MPTITLNRKVFEKLVGKKLPDEELKDRISMLGTDLEKVDKNEIHVEVFPNRPDMLSEQGFARAFASFIGVKKGLKKYHVKKSGEKVVVESSVKNIRPYTACAIVKNMKFDDEKIKEIIQIQEKLHVTYGRNRKKLALGVYPYEKIKPPIRLMAKKPLDIRFRPLEYPTELNAIQILQKHPVGREYAHLVDGLDKFAIFIDSNDMILSFTPITNSHDTGKITEKTTEVFIECSGFDFDALQKCLNIVVTAMADMGGDVYSMELEYPDKKIVTPNLEPAAMKVSLSYVNKWLGLELKENEFKHLLEKMGLGYENKKVIVPAYRADILHQVDIAEDIAIAYGYENLAAEIPNVMTIAEESRIEKFKRRIVELLVGLGLNELNTYNLASENSQTKLMNADIPLVKIGNALNEECNVCRAWVVPSLLEVLKANKHHEYPQRIFDIGTIFKKSSKTETGVVENERLAIALCHDKVDFTEIKQILDYLMRALNLNYDVSDAEHSSFIPGRVARVAVGKKNVAYMGEMHPQVLSHFDLTLPVAVLELNLTDLLGMMD
jgi:phenylalanyl-tRNA synthetase beta chain